MVTYRGKTALITGASTGIGAVFAQALAQRGMHLILVARSEDKLQTLAAELVGKHGIRAEAISADLSRAGAAKEIYTEVCRRGWAVDLLINNAGFGTYGPFETLDPQRDHAQIMLNVAALVDLTHAFIPAMEQRGTGGVINVASIAGHQPVPYMAVYGATKAFVLSFSEALWAEYRDRGVRVLALCPGMTATPFHEIAQEPPVGEMSTPEEVVAVGLRAFEQGRSYVIPKLTNFLLSGIVPRLFPRELIALITRRMMRPGVAVVVNPQG
ncbi:SDR family NAD(P)-dependent oxidoreductase [Anthocerotibacter panamensis]|uniref:SDR family NAD(P)-dependent oxidoreductase n=1 Tax=Anthocerotibacter panamensis TaxID=2857077 RepID=UPI001C403F3B|nr:SDR family oxidoreductase [Anthocerotibacter panamensis]